MPVKQAKSALQEGGAAPPAEQIKGYSVNFALLLEAAVNRTGTESVKEPLPAISQANSYIARADSREAAKGAKGDGRPLAVRMIGC